MELKAENKFTVTRELYIEGSLRLGSADYGSFVKKVIVVLALVWVGTTAYALWKGGTLFYPVFELVVIGLIILWIAVLAPRQRAKRGWEAMQNRSGGSMERDTRFYEDRLEVSGGSGELIVNYEDVVRTIDTPHMLILVSRDKQGVMLLKDGFTLGGTQDVLALIKEWSV